MITTKWPKTFPELTLEQKQISDDFMKHWHEVLADKYGVIDKFNHNYIVANSKNVFERTLEVGAGLGEHLEYEKLTPAQKQNYIALELRENMAEKIRLRFPEVQTCVGDCQERLPFANDHFDRILAIHVLEHLPNLPAAVQELHRLCDKTKGELLIVIPCEGGLAYSLARKISAQRIFEKKYNQSYKWFIEREHVNQPHEILEELAPLFDVQHKKFFPFLLPSVQLNLCIGLTLKPKNHT